jgi:hypothetical protein
MATESIGDIVQVGASPQSRATLDELKRTGHISDLMDGYRLAISVAIAFGREPRAQRGERRTMFAAGNLDSDLSLRTTIREIYPAARDWPYRAAEDLAEQGLEIISGKMDGEMLWMDELYASVRAANEPRAS